MNGSELLFTQTYMAGRVVKLGEELNVQFSILGGQTLSWSFDNENDAKIFYSTMEDIILASLGKLQEVIINSTS